MDIYICPVCQQFLYKHEKYYQCSNKHTFDIAREGYVNLLLAHQKKSKSPGDSKKMVKSRRKFLSSGYYDPMISLIHEAIVENINSRDDNLNILDAGCGEGHVLWKLGKLLIKDLSNLEYWGVDISKYAVKLAARRDKRGKFAVASVFNIPVLSESLDFVINVFAPDKRTELYRILKKEGYYISVEPGPNHLLDLKDKIYETPTKHDHEREVLKNFELVETKRKQYNLKIIEGEDIENLLVMTPYYWHTSIDKFKHISNLDELSTRIDFVLSAYKKTS